MAVVLKGAALGALRASCTLGQRHFLSSLQKRPGLKPSFAAAGCHQGSCSVKFTPSNVPQTSLSHPPWPELAPFDLELETERHREVVQKVNQHLAAQAYGRLFAVVHLASRQWKVTNEDLVIIENHLEAECGDRIRLEKVLLVGGEDFTLIGRPLLGRDLVKVEATIIEKTESWPKVQMRFLKRHRYQRKRIIIQPQTVLRINTIEVAPNLC